MVDDGVRTFFSNTEIFYKDLLPNGEIETKQFLAASSGVAHFVGLMGTVFSPVKNDIEHNVHKITVKFDENPNHYVTLQAIVNDEAAHTAKGKVGRATEALLWLKRGLQFLCAFLDHLVDDSCNGEKMENLVPLFQAAYESTLKKHHNFISRQLVKVCLHATPWRKDLLKTLAYDVDGLEDKCITDLQSYLISMKINVDAICQFYIVNGLGD